MSGDRTHTVVVLAKSPEPGRVKTRLQPVFSAGESAALAAAALRDTLAAVAAFGPERFVVAWDGPPVPWLPDGVCVLPQRGSSLDERLENVFEDVFAGGAAGPVVLVGMDTPQLTAADLDVDWSGRDVVLGPSWDGGYWAIGFRRHVPGSILGVPMSVATTGAEQQERLASLGLTVGLLGELRDVDTPDDAAAVTASAPGSRFGRLYRRLVDSPCSPVTLFDAALAGHPVHLTLEDAEPPAVVDVAAWQRLSDADEALLSRCEGPVLDVGCGPGRLVEALAARGVPALGVDLSRGAVALTQGRGGTAVLGDVHDALPGEGAWGTILLADGNIGIGGDPLSLLRRCRELLRPGAAVLVEVSPDAGVDRRVQVTLHGPGGRFSAPVPWAVVGSEAVVRLGRAAGFAAEEQWEVAGRSFHALRLAA